MRAKLLTLCLSFSIACFSGTGLAQEEVGGASIVEQVEAHNQKGVAHYQKGEFPEAIAEMLKAYHLMPEPGLLFNVAKIYQKMNEVGLAEKYYRKFVAEDEADPEKVKEALAQISAMQDDVKRKQNQAKEEKAAREKAAALEVERKEIAEKEKARQAAQKIAEAKANETCLPCWLASGMAVGTLGVASTMGYLALEEQKAFENSFAANLRSEAAQNSTQYALLADIAWGASGVIAITSGFLFYRHATRDTSTAEVEE